MLTLAAFAATNARSLETFPRPDELFPKLLAAPKQFQLGASHYDLNGRATSDMSLGHSWGLLRDRAGDQMWQWQWDARAMSFSRWSDGRLDAVDLLGELPVSVRRGDVSFIGSIFHESAHLGDDHIRLTGRAARRTTATGLRALMALEPWVWLRAYGGTSFLLDTAPSPKRWGLQTGLEAMSKDLQLADDFPIRAYIAEDLRFPERVGFNPNSHLVAGLKVGYKNSQKSMRVQLGYYSGHSYYGQFQTDREHFADLSLIFEL
jgi:hypothetical protein